MKNYFGISILALAVSIPTGLVAQEEEEQFWILRMMAEELRHGTHLRSFHPGQSPRPDLCPRGTVSAL